MRVPENDHFEAFRKDEEVARHTSRLGDEQFHFDGHFSVCNQ